MKKATKAQLKKARKLMRDKQFRDRENLFVAEGLKIVSDIMRKGHTLDSIIVSQGFVKKKENKVFLNEAHSRTVPVFVTDNDYFGKISSLQHSQGVLVLVRKGACQKDNEPVKGRDKLLVLCDGIQDPGNIGAIIRTSVAFGVSAILFTGEVADVYNPKVVRSSSGMVLDIGIYPCSLAKLKHLKKEGYRLLVSGPHRQNMKDISCIEKFSDKTIIAFGSEGKGVSRGVLSLAEECFYIPIYTGAESLNVAAACAISLYAFAGK